MSRRRYPTAQRREQIAEAALKLLGAAPMASVTTRAVAQVVGISQPAIFRHFRNREALLVAAVEHARRLLGERMELIFTRAPFSLDLVTEMVGALLAFVEEHPGLPRLLFAEMPDAGRELAAALGRLQGMPRSLVAELLRVEVEAGRARPEMIEAGADGFLGLVQGAILIWQRAGQPPGLVHRAGPLMDLWLHGVARPSGVAPPEPPPPRTQTPPLTASTEPALRLLDVRPLLAKGVEPLDTIMGAVRASPPGTVLVLVAPFLPKPLLALLGRRGHSTHARALDGRAGWSTIIRLGGGAILDLSEVEPPGPLEKILEAVAAGALPVVARVPRYPVLLLERLRAQGQRVDAVALDDGAAVVRVAAG